MGVASSRTLRSHNYAHMKEFARRSTSVPFRWFLGDVRRQFMYRHSVVLFGALGSYPRDALQEGIADVVACFPPPRAY
jgi:hypothetical protein